MDPKQYYISSGAFDKVSLVNVSNSSLFLDSNKLFIAESAEPRRSHPGTGAERARPTDSHSREYSPCEPAEHRRRLNNTGRTCGYRCGMLVLTCLALDIRSPSNNRHF